MVVYWTLSPTEKSPELSTDIAIATVVAPIALPASTTDPACVDDRPGCILLATEGPQAMLYYFHPA